MPSKNPGVPLSAPTATLPGMGIEVEAEIKRVKEGEERERLAWCERYNAAQPVSLAPHLFK